jgi:hypothetical protein
LAITAYGGEFIPEDELKLRLETLKIGTLTSLQTSREPLTGLMIGFFFKEGKERSTWEFLHKSFREYLAAEAIVEVLKRFVSTVQDKLREKPMSEYWSDFQTKDPRYGLTRTLGEVFCGQLLSDEILAHIHALLEWELQNSFGTMQEKAALNAPDDHRLSLKPDEWRTVRDALADIWDWWGEGVHLRLQPRPEEGVWKTDDPPFVHLLQRRSMRRINYNQSTPPRPPRTATIDALLGYAFFELCSLVHGLICQQQGWLKSVEDLGPEGLWSHLTSRPRRYQVSIRHQGVEYIQFAPSGQSNLYFRNYALRIVGAGVSVSRSIDFPGGSYMVGISLARADLRALDFDECDMRTCNLAVARLYQASARGANLNNAILTSAELDLADFDGCSMRKADVGGAVFWAATLKGVNLQNVTGLTQEQVNQMSSGTRSGLPSGLEPPAQWR